MATAVAYYRVSTAQQGRSGLGLDAQRAAVAQFAQAQGYDLREEFTEVETGKGCDALTRRPQLAAALQRARKLKGPVIVAKLDRLTRNVEFGAGLLNRGVQFRLADTPDANNLLIHILLSIAQEEVETISRRTRAALQAARARGVKLGGPNGCAMQKNRALAFAESLRAVVTPIIDLPSRQIAAHLNERGITTSTGGAWQSETVLRLINRLEIA